MGHLDLILRLASGEMRYNCLITSNHRLHLRRRTPTSRLTHRLEMEEATMPNVPHPSNAPQPRHEQPCGLTLAELEAELAEARPERAPAPPPTAPDPPTAPPVASTAAPEPSTTAPEPSTTAPEPTATAVEPS